MNPFEQPQEDEEWKPHEVMIRVAMNNRIYLFHHCFGSNIGSGSNIARWTVRLLLGADCLFGAMYIQSLLKHKSRRCSSEFSHFLSTITCKPIRKILRKE